MAPVTAGIVLQVAAMRSLLSKLKTSLTKPISQIGLNSNGITLNTLGTAIRGTSITAGPDASGKDSSISVIPDGGHSIVIERSNGGSITVNNDGVKIEKLGGGGNIHVNSNGVTLKKGGDNGGKGALSDNEIGRSVARDNGFWTTQNETVMAKGSNYINIGNNGIELNFTQGGVFKSGLIKEQANMLQLG